MRHLLKHTTAALIIFSTAASSNTSLDFTSIEKQVHIIEKHLSAKVGLSILEVPTQKVWSYKGDLPVPLTSTFKTLACAKLLNDADKGQVALNTQVKVEKQLLEDYSPVLQQYTNKEVTLKDACSATMRTSDNTAANIVLKHIGGPVGLTQFIRSYGDSITHLDRYEPDLNEGKPGDERDTTTPNAMAQSLNILLFGTVLSKPSKDQLQQWMKENQVSDNLLRSVLPEGWQIADRSGAGGYGARSITAVVWPKQAKQESPVIITLYITQTRASFDERNKAIARIGKAIFTTLDKE